MRAREGKGEGGGVRAREGGREGETWSGIEQRGGRETE